MILAVCAFPAFSPIYNAEAPTVLGQAQDSDGSNFGYGYTLNSDKFSLTNDGTLLPQDSIPQYYPFRDLSVTNPIIDAQAFLLLSWNRNDGSTRILFQKNANQALAPASLTKLMTALVALDLYSPDQIIEVSQEAANQDSNTVKLKAHEHFTVKDLLKIALIPSSNNAAYALADAYGYGYGGEPEFVAKMNEKAKIFGLKNTNFVNPHGLDATGHVSCASDIAVLLEEAAKNPLILSIIETASTTVYSTEGKAYKLTTTNKLLNQMGTVGGKTGYTNNAGQCLAELISVPENPDKYLVTVVLNASDKFIDTADIIYFAQKAFSF